MQHARTCAVHRSADSADSAKSVDSVDAVDLSDSSDSPDSLCCLRSTMPGGVGAANPSVLELKRSLQSMHDVERAIARSRRRRAIAAITLFVAVIVIFVRAVVLRA